MLQVCNVGICYASWVLRHLDFSLQAGQVLAVLGPNGRGKSSLLRVMAGLARPQEGQVQCDASVAYVPQFIHTSFEMTALDLVLTGRARHIGWKGAPSAHDRAVAHDCLRRLDADRFADRGIHHLSGGERQLVLMARALASGCQVMLLDEPASALDFHNQALILEVMRDLAHREGMTVVFTTHVPQHALEIADQSLLLLDAQEFLCGPTLDTVTSEALTRLYHLPIQRMALAVDGRAVQTAIPLYHAIAQASASFPTPSLP